MSDVTLPEPEACYAFLLDAAPVERSWLDAILTKVLTSTDDTGLLEELTDTALAYARAVADRAFTLGLELGRAKPRPPAQVG
jgi:hypothetical protein